MFLLAVLCQSGRCGRQTIFILLHLLAHRNGQVHQALLIPLFPMDACAGRHLGRANQARLVYIILPHRVAEMPHTRGGPVQHPARVVAPARAAVDGGGRRVAAIEGAEPQRHSKRSRVRLDVQEAAHRQRRRLVLRAASAEMGHERCKNRAQWFDAEMCMNAPARPAQRTPRHPPPPRPPPRAPPPPSKKYGSLVQK